jgi:CubicO group peptidase (beta-lactamase class C family)
MSLQEFVQATAEKFGVPGAAVGVLVGGREEYACHGVTSVENPLPVDEHTLFTLGSVTKTVTATAVMRLVAEGRVDLAAPVRRYVPEVTGEFTVMNLLNHTAGLDWHVLVDTGEGDDALARFVPALNELPTIGKPGERASYSQAGYNLAGRIVETVTGMTYERAVTELVMAPAGLTNSFFFTGDVLTRRFAVGHNRAEDGVMAVSRQWKGSRANNPGGGLVSSVSDQLRWARFHLGDGAGVLPAEVLRQMREPTVALRASALGDAIGTSWFLRDIGASDATGDGGRGVRTIGHGGSGFGQFAELLIVPERDFAVVAAVNEGPDGIPFNQAVVRWALAHYLGVVDRDPEPVPYDAARAAEIVGHYGIDAMTFDITTDGESLTLDVRIRPELRASSDTEMPPDPRPAPFGLLPDDEYVVTDGEFAGQRGFFSRDERGAVVGVDLAGRLFSRMGRP